MAYGSQSPAGVACDVTVSGPNAQSLGKPFPLLGEAGRYLTCVQVVGPAGIPHGRYYAVLTVNRDESAAPTPNDVRCTIWAGYVSDFNPPSFPQLLIAPRDTLFLTVTAGSGGVANDLIKVILTCADQQTGHTSIFNESPGSGPGEIVRSAFGNPAAGADQPNFQLPNFVRRRYLSIVAQLVTSGAAGNRQRWVFFTRSGGTPIAQMTCPVIAAPASVITVHAFLHRAGVRAFFGDTGTSQNDTGAAATSAVGDDGGCIPDVVLVATDKITHFTVGLVAADQYSNLVHNFEEWAFPAP